MTVSQQMIQQFLGQSIQIADQLEDSLNKFRAQVIEDMKKLKDGERSVDELMITDNGYEFIPKPAIDLSGKDKK